MASELELVITIVGKVFDILQSPLLQGMKDYKSDLERLSETVSTIRNVLLDADKKAELSHEEQGWIKRLKNALYDADDFFDECLTIAELEQLKSTADRFSDKVRKFFSDKNSVVIAYRMSRSIRNMRKKLDGIAQDHQKFRLAVKVDSQAIRMRGEESCSYVHEPDVVGRENDLKELVGILLDSGVKENVSFLPIVGVGGLGKTTLAQLVYNDAGVDNEFSLKFWVCVSDQDGSKFDMKSILCKIIELATGKKNDDGTTMESVQCQLQEVIGGKKFLLILDDVWNEDRKEWLKFKQFLVTGGRGSRIVVTTRSRITATMITDEPHELKGLSPKDSWKLFKMTAIDKHQEHVQEFVEIGEKIVKKCCNVPLAIKVVGSLLYGQNIGKWKTFEMSGLDGIGNGKNEIMSILKLSYHNLEPSLKSCFAYCALFPKNFEIEKELLIDLWMAQGYIVPFDKGQNIEDASEEHFLILLRRCFFQDVKKNKYGDVKSFKIHDLMHDLAQKVAENEICIGVSAANKLGDDGIRHLYEASCTSGDINLTKSKIRSCLVNSQGICSKDSNSISKEWMYLRALGLFAENMPDSIGDLLHLRYLKILQSRFLRELPNSITKLHNLQSLDLSGCERLEQLPKHFHKLVNLRHLYLYPWKNLTCMPWGMDRLTRLCTLTDFVVSNESSSGKQRVGQLKDLKALVNLKGSINLWIRDDFISAGEYDWEGGCLEDTRHLQSVKIHFPLRFEDSDAENDKILLQKLKPPPTLRRFELSYYVGAEIPMWGRIVEDTWLSVLPNLVKLKLYECRWLRNLPSLSKLQNLKFLHLSFLQNLEYMEEETSTSISNAAATSSEYKESEFTTFFPSLVSLEIWTLPKLRAWWRPRVGLVDTNTRPNWQPSLPRLAHLIIESCPELISFPPCPSLETLKLKCNNENLQIMTSCYDRPSALMQTVSRNALLSLSVDLDRVRYFKSLPIERLTSIKILGTDQMQNISELIDVIKKCPSLHSLSIAACDMLSMSGTEGLEHVAALKSLDISSCSRLKWENEEANDNGMHWRPLHHSLRVLKLFCIRDLESFPKRMQYLTSLQELDIWECQRLQALPQWISCLSSLSILRICDCPDIRSLPETMPNLTSLKIVGCPYLKATCKKPSGTEWPKIQHIPHIDIPR